MSRDLAPILHDAWANAPEGEVVVRIHLFGIRYAKALQGPYLRALVGRAGIPMPYMTEVRKGVRLAEFVSISPGDAPGHDLSSILHDAWANAPEGEVVVRIHLFGIRYAKELEGADLRALVGRAGIPMPYMTEVRKGVRLAEFVTIGP